MSQYGTAVLYEGTEPIEADIIFVHGLGGDSTDTWSKDGVLWPKDLLKERVPHARIMTWGYDAHPMHFLKQQGHQTVLSHAQDLLADMNLERESDEEKTRPVIFVGHSLGGLVIKQALCKAVEYTGQSGRRYARQAMIGTYCSGIVFMGTPHRGAESAAWATTATRMAQFLGKSGNDEITSALKSGSSTLESLQDSFAGIQGRFNIHTVLEAQGMHGIGKIVEDHHATLGCDTEQTFHIQADHKAMCKFSDKKDNGYRRVAGAIREQVEDARTMLDQRPALNPQSLGAGGDSQRLRRASPAAPDTSHRYPANTSYPRQAPPTNAFDTSALRESLESESDKAGASPPPPYSRGSDPPPLPSRKSPLSQSTFKRLFEEAIAIEGPCPPEKYQRFINRLKQLKTWTASAETFKNIFAPKFFDPASAKSKGDFLYLASYVGDEESVRLALSAGADVDYSLSVISDSPFNAAMTFDHTNVIELLLKAGASMTHMTNLYATNEQKYFMSHLTALSAKTVRLILEHRGKDAFPSHVVLSAAANCHFSVLQVLVEKEFKLDVSTEEGETALHLAARHDQKETVSYLLNMGFPIDAVDSVKQTPLYDAILSCNHEMVALLLDNDAKVNIVDIYDDTPVHVLIENPKDTDGVPFSSEELIKVKLAMLQMLHIAGAALEVLNGEGMRPLHLAIKYGLGEIAALLILCGVNCEARDSDGWTPLHLCAAGQGAQVQIALLCIQQGASLKAKLPAPNLWTPIDVAKRVANATMVSLYQDARRGRGIDKWFARRGIA